MNHVKRLPLSLEIFLFLSKLIYFNWIRILIDLEIEQEKWNIGHDNLINVIGIDFIYFNFWYLHPDAINLIYVREMTDIGVPVGTTLYKSKSLERSSDSIRTWMPGLFHEFEYLGLQYQQSPQITVSVMLVTSWCWWHYDGGDEPTLDSSMFVCWFILLNSISSKILISGLLIFLKSADWIRLIFGWSYTCNLPHVCHVIKSYSDNIRNLLTE